jgi:head decoration protein D
MAASATNTYSADELIPMYPDVPHPMQPVKLPASVTYPKGTVLGEVTATPGTFKAYDDAAVDGTATARCILQRACATDASGNITFGTSATGDAFGQTHKSAPAFFGGSFKTSDLKQSGAGAIDAAAVTDLGGHLISGTLSNGVLVF